MSFNTKIMMTDDMHKSDSYWIINDLSQVSCLWRITQMFSGYCFSVISPYLWPHFLLHFLLPYEQKSRTTCFSLNSWHRSEIKKKLQGQQIYSLHACSHTHKHSHTQHWILAKMAPNGLVIKGWCHVCDGDCVTLYQWSILASCPDARQKERKNKRKTDRKHM